MSFLTGLPVDDVAAQVIAVMSGLRGPLSGVVGPDGRLASKGLSLISLSGDSARQHQLAELLLAPARHYQRQLRELSHTVSHRALKQDEVDGPLPKNSPDRERSLYQSEISRQKHLTISADRSGGNDWDQQQWDSTTRCASDAGEMNFRAVTHRSRLLLRQPSLLLDSPPASEFCGMLEEVHDRCPLILDPSGSFLLEIFRSDSSNPETRARQALSRVLRGCDQQFKPSSPDQGPGSIEHVKAHLFATLPHAKMIDLLAHQDEAEELLRHCVLTKPLTGVTAVSPPQLSPQQLRSAYETYRMNLKDVIVARRSGRGMTFQVQGESGAFFQQMQLRYLERLDAVDEELRPYVANLVSVPATLVWGSFASVQEGADRPIVINQIERLSISVLDRHVELLKDLLVAVRHRRMARCAEEMCRKILTLQPCTFREVLRTYGKQARDLHQPVLDYLIESGFVTEDDHSKLCLTDSATARMKLAPQLSAPHKSSSRSSR